MRKHTLVILIALLAGCGSDDDGDGAAIGAPTGATCPDGGTSLTWKGFAEPFVESYCLRCHSDDVSGTARQGAPRDHNFDTHFECRAFAAHMDQWAGAGPDAINTAMPPSEPRPSEEERRMLSEWLACGAP